MKNENFLLLNCVEKTYWYINKILVNIPKNEMVIKTRIDEYMVKMLENIFSFQLNQKSDKIKTTNLKNIIINLSMIDFYITEFYKREYIKKKKYESVCNFLLEIKKLTFGLLRDND